MTLSLPSPNDTPPDASKRPRRSWTLAEQTAYVADFAASGLSATAFCRRLGIRRATLARWRARAAAGAPPRRVAPRIARSGAGGFAAVTVVPDAAAAAGPALSAAPASPLVPPLTLVLRAPSGVVAHVAGLDLATATALLRAVLTPATAPMFLATGVTDLRCGMNRLYALILGQLGQEPLSGALFDSCNRPRDTVKLFCFDEGGVWVAAKRLESGTFRRPCAGARTIALAAADLHLLLSGVDPTRTRLRRWWMPVDPAPAAPPSAGVPVGDASAHALRGRVVDLEGEVARLTLRVKDLQQQLWGRKAERGLGATADGAAALSLFAAADATLPTALPESVVAGVTAPSARRAGSPAHSGPKPLDPALVREVIVLPGPPAADRRCPVTGAPRVPRFAERLEVLARRAPVYFVKRYERGFGCKDMSHVSAELGLDAAELRHRGPSVRRMSRADFAISSKVRESHYSASAPIRRGVGRLRHA